MPLYEYYISSSQILDEHFLGISRIFSFRCIYMSQKMDESVILAEILFKMCILKQWGGETRSGCREDTG